METKLVDKCCSNCAFYSYVELVKDSICINSESESFAEWANENDTCDSWEENK